MRQVKFMLPSFRIDFVLDCYEADHVLSLSCESPLHEPIAVTTPLELLSATSHFTVNARKSNNFCNHILFFF